MSACDGGDGGLGKLVFVDAAVERGRRQIGSSPAHFARLCKRLRRIYHARGLKSQDRVTDARSTRWTLPVPVLFVQCTAVCIDRKQCCFWKVSAGGACACTALLLWVRDGPERFPPVGPAAGARERNRPEAATGAGGGAGASSFAVRAAFSGSHLSCGHARRCCKTLPTTSWRMSRHLRASWLPTARAQRWRRATSKWPSVRRRRAPPARLSPST